MPADTASSADTIGIDPSALFQVRNIYLGVSDGLFAASIFAGAEPAKSFTVQIFFCTDSYRDVLVCKIPVRKFWKPVRESCNPVPGGLQEVFVL